MKLHPHLTRAWDIQGRDGVVSIAETPNGTEVVVRCSTVAVHLSKGAWDALTGLRYEVDVEEIEQQALTVLASEPEATT